MIKHILYIILFSVTICPLCYQQGRDSLIRLSPGMEDTIGFIEREYFGLFNQIDGYEFASLFIRNKKELISRITFSEDGRLKDTILINDLSVLENTRLKIQQIEDEQTRKIKSLRNVAVTTHDKTKYEGVLEGFSNSYLYLSTEKDFLTNQDSPLKYRLPLSIVSQVLIKGESNYLSPVLWGTGIGLVLGILGPIGLNGFVQEHLDPDSEPEIKFSSELIVSGIVCAFIGAGIGYIVGWLSADDDIPVKFISTRSVLRLKDYAHYNYRYPGNFNKNYLEIK